MRVCSLASGSSGNCIFAGTDETSVLVDTGISGKRTGEGLHEIGRDLGEIDAILITHEHADHISGLGVISRKYGIPIYATKGTIDAISRSQGIGQIPDGLFHEIEPDREFAVGDLTACPVAVSHDAAQPVDYVLRCGKRSAAIVTDLGEYGSYLTDRLQDLDVILLEANHDVHMLETGRYPYYLKQRILGSRGHLSNEMAGRLLNEVLHDGLQAAILGHLSKENNYERLAYETVRMEIEMADTPYHAGDFPIYVAKRDEVSEIVEIA